MKLKRNGKAVSIFTIKFLVGLLICSPVLLAIMFSFFPNTEIGTIPLKFITKNPTLENFAYVFNNVPIFTYLKNSLIMLVIVIPIQIVLGSLAAYSFAFFDFPLKNALFTIVLSALAIPGEVTIIANYGTVQSMGLTDTYLGLCIISFVDISGMFMLRQHMMSLPPSLWEAARMDGCGHMRYFASVVLPLSKSIIIAKVLNGFIGVYNAYVWPMMVTSTEEMRTIQTGIAGLVRDMYWNPGGALAGAVVSMIIPVAIYIIGLDQIVAGMTAGAVKN